MGVNHDFLSGNFVYTPLDDCPTIYRKHQDYSLSKFKKDLKNEKILNNYKDALEELRELREYKRLTTLRNKKYEESIHAYKNQIRNLKKHMYCGSEVNIKLINVFISLIYDIIEHLCLDPYRSIFSSLPFIHTILCSSPIRDKKIYCCSKLVHTTLTQNVNQSKKKSNSIGTDVEPVRNTSMYMKEDINLHKVVSDLEWLSSETNDKAWLTLQDRWEICKIDLKWLCVSTNNRTWILYRHIWDQCPDDLKFITVLTNEKKWLNLYKLWRTIPLSTKLKAIVSNNPDLCKLTCSDILMNDDPIYKVDVLSLHHDISSLLQQNSLKSKLVALSDKKERTRDTLCRHSENVSDDEDGDSDYMKSFVKIRELEKEMHIKNFMEDVKDSGTTYRKETEEPKDHSLGVTPTNTLKKEMNLKDSLSKNMNLMNTNVKEASKLNNFSKKMGSPTIKKEEPSKVSLKIPTLTKKDPIKFSPKNPVTVLDVPEIPKKDAKGQKELPKITVPKSFGLKKQVELKKTSLPFVKKEISTPKMETVKESKEEASYESENMVKENKILTKEDNTIAKENKIPPLKTKIPTIKDKIPAMKNKMPPMKNKMPVKENEAVTKIQVKPSIEGNEEDEDDEEEGVLIEGDQNKLGVGQRILDTITKIILPQGNIEETKDNKEALQKELSSKETNNPTPTNINNTTIKEKAKMDPTSMNKLLLKKKEGIKKPGPSPVPPSLSKPIMKPPFNKTPTEKDQFKIITPTKAIPKEPNKEDTVADKIYNFANTQSLNEARENKKEENVNNKIESEETMTKTGEPLRKKSSKEIAKYSNLNIEIQKNKLSEEKSKLSKSLLENEKDSNKHPNILTSFTDIENKTRDETIQRKVSIQEKRTKSGLSHKYIDLKKEFGEGTSSSNSISKAKIPLKTKPVFDKNSYKLISPMKKPPPILKKVLESDLSDLDTTNKRPTADVIAKRTNVSLYIDVKRKNSLSSLKAQNKMFLPPKFPKMNL